MGRLINHPNSSGGWGVKIKRPLLFKLDKGQNRQEYITTFCSIIVPPYF